MINYLDQMKTLMQERDEARRLLHESQESLFAALSYSAEQIERRCWRKWSEGLSFPIHGTLYHVTLIVDPEGDASARHCCQCGQELAEDDVACCERCRP